MLNEKKSLHANMKFFSSMIQGRRNCFKVLEIFHPSSLTVYIFNSPNSLASFHLERRNLVPKLKIGSCQINKKKKSDQKILNGLSISSGNLYRVHLQWYITFVLSN